MSVLRSAVWIDIPNDISIAELMEQSAPNIPSDKIIYEDALTQKTTTYSAFRTRVRSAAYWLTNTLNFQPGQTVSIVCPSCTDYIVAAHAVWWAGGVISPVNDSLHHMEVSHIFDVVRPDIIIVHGSHYSKIQESLRHCQRLSSPRILTLGKTIPGTTEFPASVPPHQRLAERPVGLQGRPSNEVVAAICMSSGTTGRPKGVMLSHYNLVAALHQLRGDNPDNWRASMREVFFPPLSHVYALYVCITGCAWLGAYVCLLPRFDLKVYCRLLHERKATLARLVPPIAKILAESSEVQKYTYPYLEYFSCSAAPLTSEVATKLARAFPTTALCQTYGATELSGPCAQSGVRDAGLPLSAGGKLIANTEMRFLDADCGDVGSKGPGEITVRGPNIFMGYKDSPTATSETILEGGWCRTGDVGYIDANGFLVIFDRIKDIIKYKGFQVSPTELEEILVQHPMVDEVAVCGLWSDEQSSELPRAYVVLRPGKTSTKGDRDAAAASIAGFLAERVSKYKQLTGGVVFMDALPKNPTGKVLRKVLRDRGAMKNDGVAKAKL